MRDAGLAIKGVTGSATAFENAWRRIVLDVARGQTEEMQAARPQILAAFEKRLRELKETHALALWLSKLGRTGLPDPDVLSPEIARLERLKARCLTRGKPPTTWKTSPRGTTRSAPSILTGSDRSTGPRQRTSPRRASRSERGPPC